MGEKYSKEDHDKCKKVAEVFQELYDILGDTCVLDAGEFGFVYLTYYREQKSCFDRNKVYRNADGAIAVAMLQKAPVGYYDVILMDIQMPKMNGYQATEAIRKLPDERKQEYAVRKQQFMDQAELKPE